jgi:predicted methyltransferase
MERRVGLLNGEADQPTRRSAMGLLAAGGLTSALLAACGRKSAAPSAPQPASGGKGGGPASLADFVAGAWRSPADRARDPWRHPVETLQFFGIAPGMTVVELWPGAGWYTQILAPYLKTTGGKLYAATFVVPNADDPEAQPMVAEYQKLLKVRPDLYGDVVLTAFGPLTGPICPDKSADLVLFLRNLHNWIAAGYAEKAFHDAFAALKPGGVLGIEEHRAAPGGAQDPVAASGYVQTDYVKKLAEEAGFVFDKASEINANPKDTRNHPFGVWTLPPTRRSSPRGAPPNPFFLHSKYDAIGESDRMTLRFVKPK